MKNTFKGNTGYSSGVRAATGILLFFVSLSVFSGMIFGHLRLEPDSMNYFKDFAIAYNNGRLDIPACPPGTDCYDIINYHGKIYMYQPQVPAIVYMPIVKIWGRNTPDRMINAFIGALNTVMIFFILILLGGRLELKIPSYMYTLLALFWAFGTVHFYLSMLGAVWYTAQVMGQFFILLAILLALAGGGPAAVALSGLSFAMAAYTKNDLAFYIVFIAAVYAAFYMKGKDRRSVARDAVIFILPFVLFSIASLMHNAARFDGRFFDNGIAYHNMNQVFVYDFKTYGYLSPVYIPYNLFTEVFMPPPFSLNFPFFAFNREGFGFLWDSPLFLLSFAAIWTMIYGSGKKKADAEKNRTIKAFLKGAFISLGLVMLLIFVVMGNGWAQFASRYSLDYQFLMIACMLPVIHRFGGSRKFNIVFMILLALSLYMNFFGAKMFLGL